MNKALTEYKAEYAAQEPSEIKKNFNDLLKFRDSILIKGVDFGPIPYIKGLHLFKPGAEKIRALFGLRVELDQVSRVVDLETSFISYTYKARVFSREGTLILSIDRAANSYEKKFLKAAGVKYDKVKKQFSDPGPRHFGVIGIESNILAMAEKRAFVAGIKAAVCGSQFEETEAEPDQEPGNINDFISDGIEAVSLCSDIETLGRVRAFFQKLELDQVPGYMDALKNKQAELEKPKVNEREKKFFQALNDVENGAELTDLLIFYDDLSKRADIREKIRVKRETFNANKKQRAADLNYCINYLKQGNDKKLSLVQIKKMIVACETGTKKYITGSPGFVQMKKDVLKAAQARETEKENLTDEIIKEAAIAGV